MAPAQCAKVAWTYACVIAKSGGGTRPLTLWFMRKAKIGAMRPLCEAEGGSTDASLLRRQKDQIEPNLNRVSCRRAGCAIICSILPTFMSLYCNCQAPLPLMPGLSRTIRRRGAATTDRPDSLRGGGIGKGLDAKGKRWEGMRKEISNTAVDSTIEAGGEPCGLSIAQQRWGRSSSGVAFIFERSLSPPKIGRMRVLSWPWALGRPRAYRRSSAVCGASRRRDFSEACCAELRRRGKSSSCETTCAAIAGAKGPPGGVRSNIRNMRCGRHPPRRTHD